MPLTYTVHVTFGWWVYPYLGLCRLGAALGFPLGIDRIAATAVRGIRVGARCTGPFRRVLHRG